jgi:hypothetical protein
MLARPLFGIVASVSLIVGTSANALPNRFHHYYPAQHNSYSVQHAGTFNYHRANNVYRANSFSHAAVASRTVVRSEEQIVAHPFGCPRTLFCGCGAARELGLSDQSLWAVKTWYKFPRAAAAPGMALLWGERHVAAIRAVHGDGTVTVYDANSGGGLTRVHRISLNGLVVVDPHAGHHGEPTFASFPPAAREQATAKSVPANDEKRAHLSDLKPDRQND